MGVSAGSGVRAQPPAGRRARAQRRLAEAAAVALLLALGWLLLPTAAFADDYEPIPIDTGVADRPFDLGVADIDRDRDLDIYGANHNRRAPLLLNDGDGGFRERLYQRGLAQQSLFPGFEDGTILDSFPSAGLYVYAEGTERIVFRNSGTEGTLSGYMRAPEDFFLTTPTRAARRRELGRRLRGLDGAERAQAIAEWQAERSAVPRVRVIEEGGDSIYQRLEFVLPPDTELRANPRFLEYPLQIAVAGIDPGEIYLGPQRINPAETSFTLTYRDRHAFAWAQLGGDERPDALIVRGGIKGHISDVPDLISDELLVADADGYVEVGERAGLEKDGCRGRGVRPADLGSDGDVDVLIECEEGDPLLFEQTRPGHFENRSEVLAGIGAQNAEVRWVPLRLGGAPELMVVGDASFGLFRVSAKKAVPLGRVDSFGAVKGLSAADFDGDGDQDVMASSLEQSTLLVHRRGSFEAIRPQRIGLPATGMTASWVDADGDGRLDLHDYQRGFYMQGRKGKFERADKLAIGSPAETPIVARAIFFDGDNDGDRDVVVAEHFGGRRDDSRYLAYEDTGTPRNHWLEVELEGPGTEVDALGASVTVEAGGAGRTAWVGESEGSRWSWGDSRLYFGLGQRATVDELTVRWSDGRRSILRDVQADRLLYLRRGSQELEQLEYATMGDVAAEALTGASAPLSDWARSS